MPCPSLYIPPQINLWGSLSCFLCFFTHCRNRQQGEWCPENLSWPCLYSAFPAFAPIPVLLLPDSYLNSKEVILVCLDFCQSMSNICLLLSLKFSSLTFISYFTGSTFFSLCYTNHILQYLEGCLKIKSLSDRVASLKTQVTSLKHYCLGIIIDWEVDPGKVILSCSSRKDIFQNSSRVSLWRSHSVPRLEAV